MTIRKTDWIFPSSRISMAGIHPFHSIPSRLLSVAFLVRRFQPMERIRSRATKLVYFERSERYFNGASERNQRSVLFVESQTTKKSVIPRRPLTSRRNGFTRFRNCARVKSSLNSNNVYLAETAIAFSRTMNSRRTLIRSKADGFSRRVLSPKR
jgi:hypothetical protein